MDEWLGQLEDLVAVGREAYGDDAVRSALEDAAEGLGRGGEALRPAVPVLGVAACAAGWVGVLVRPSGQTSLHVGSTLSSLVEQVREQGTLGAVAYSVSSVGDDLQAWLRSRPTVEVMTVELSQEQHAVVRTSGIAVPAMYPGMGFIEDDLLTACAVGAEAARHFS